MPDTPIEPEIGDGNALHFTLQEATEAARQIQVGGRLSKVEPSMYYLGCWVVFAEREGGA